MTQKDKDVMAKDKRNFQVEQNGNAEYIVHAKLLYFAKSFRVYTKYKQS